MKQLHLFTCLVLLMYCMYSHNALSQKADAGPDKVNCTGSGVEIGAMADNANYCVMWKALPADPNVDGASAMKLMVNPKKTTVYTITVIGQDFDFISTDEVKVSILDSIKIKEVSTQKYGFDNYTDKKVAWKSVETGSTDQVNVEILPTDGFEGVFFKSSLSNNVSVSPKQAAASSQNLTLSGVLNGISEVQINCEKEDGDNLGKVNVKAYSLKTKTVAIRVVHAKNYSSTDINISDADLLSQLNTVYYSQAVFNWVVIRLPDIIVDFDLNKDGLLDVESWMSSEMQLIRDNCKDDTYDHNLFIVDNPSDGSLGFMQFNQRYGFIHADISNNHANTIAHELGHGSFGFTHPDQRGDNDIENLMHSNLPNPKRLRKYQWDIINP